jgi:protein-S-isoprenylcysteine O-methyltransferase
MLCIPVGRAISPTGTLYLPESQILPFDHHCCSAALLLAFRPSSDATSCSQMLQLLRRKVEGVQRYLNFEHIEDHPSFANPKVRYCIVNAHLPIASYHDRVMHSSCWFKSLGRVSVLGCVLGIVWGFHVLLSVALTYLIFASNDQVPAALQCVTSPTTTASYRLVELWQWSSYVVALCTFHLLEFFTTVMYNPTVASADSFLVNHSIAYTAAALTSWIEFWLRFFFWRTGPPSIPWTSWVGLVGVLVSQSIRSAAMATAGESFNHYIQAAKKSNHKLVKVGIYRYLRHPSYVGFFYWCIFTQLMLGNYAHAIMFAGASWRFFQTRIEYEEESLCGFFPGEYPEYVARSYMGIPFLYTKVDYTSPREKLR